MASNKKEPTGFPKKGFPAKPGSGGITRSGKYSPAKAFGKTGSNSKG